MKETKIYSEKRNKGLIIFSIITLVVLTYLLGLAFSADKEQVLSASHFDGALPVLVINTAGAILDEHPGEQKVEINGKTITATNNSQRHLASLKMYAKDPYLPENEAVKADLETDIVINTRGQSSLVYPKKQYTVRLVDENGLENPKEVLGMSKHDKWVLNGMYSDKSLMRNYIAYKMGRQTMEYSPDTRYVEVYLKTNEFQSKEDQYQGLYLLTEKIERGPNRVPIAQNNDKYRDSSFIMARDKVKAGDIVLESDWNTFEDDYIIIPRNTLKLRTVFTVTYPSKKNITDQHKEDIISSINDFEYALRSTHFKDKREGYSKYADVDSFVKYAMINEITKNIDGGEVSAYFYKNLGEKIKAGPIWDFDQSMGNTDVGQVDEYTGFLMLNTIWYERFFQDEYFVSRYKNIYKKYRNTIWNNENINWIIDQALLEMGPAIERNNKKWYPDDSLEVYEKEVEELRFFLTERLEWIDNNIHLIKRITENAVE